LEDSHDYSLLGQLEVGVIRWMDYQGASEVHVPKINTMNSNWSYSRLPCWRILVLGALLMQGRHKTRLEQHLDRHGNNNNFCLENEEDMG